MTKRLSYQFMLTMTWIMTVILWALPAALSAHGVVWEISAKKSYGLEFTYDDESPMAYVEIKVFGPNDPAKLSQTGRTNKNGYFAFIPDADGQWLVNADDGAGHLAKAELTVSLQAASANGSAATVDAAVASVNTEREIARATKPLKMGLVISIFLNIAFLAMIAKCKKTAQ